jgi:hypothetical protein
MIVLPQRSIINISLKKEYIGTIYLFIGGRPITKLYDPDKGMIFPFKEGLLLNLVKYHSAILVDSENVLKISDFDITFDIPRSMVVQQFRDYQDNHRTLTYLDGMVEIDLKIKICFE